MSSDAALVVLHDQRGLEHPHAGRHAVIAARWSCFTTNEDWNQASAITRNRNDGVGRASRPTRIGTEQPAAQRWRGGRVGRASRPNEDWNGNKLTPRQYSDRRRSCFTTDEDWNIEPRGRSRAGSRVGRARGSWVVVIAGSSSAAAGGALVEVASLSVGRGHGQRAARLRASSQSDQSTEIGSAQMRSPSGRARSPR